MRGTDEGTHNENEEKKEEKAHLARDYWFRCSQLVPKNFGSNGLLAMTTLSLGFTDIS